jgi:hypothetical protein
MLSVALVSLPCQTFALPPCSYYEQQYIKMYKLVLAFIDLMFVLSFINIRQLIKNILGRLITWSKKKSKAVPLHAVEAHGGRGGIAPTHS